jgi:cytochrome P450
MTEAPTRDSATTHIDPMYQTTVWGDDAPTVWTELGRCPATVDQYGANVTSIAGVDQCLHDPLVFSSGPDAGFLGSETGLIPLQIDPPEHARYRRLLDPLFSPKRVQSLEADITAYANTLLDDVSAGTTCNFSEAFAIPFPVATFLRLLGLPLDGLREFLALKENIIRPDAVDFEAANRIRAQAGVDISTLFMAALQERESEPREDLLSYFIERERSGDLRREDSLNICHMLLIAGLDTVTGTLESTFALLARRPDLQRQIAASENIDLVVEELLRWVVTSPSQGRVATQDVVVDGVTIPAGTQVKIVQATVNFDPARFENPLDVNLARNPNKHATFGIGVHRCLGSHLARLEMRIALTEWHRRIPSYGLPEGYEVRYTPALRGVTDLPLVIDSME